MKTSKQPFGAKALKVIQGFFPDVSHVEDATKPLLIEVTKKDNESAAVKKHNQCALAVACKRKTAADGVIIGTRTAYVINGNEATRYRLLETTSREIVSFDRKGGFAIGAYPLKVPATYDRLGVRRGDKDRNAKPTGRNGSKLRHYTLGIRTVLGSTVTVGAA